MEGREIILNMIVTSRIDGITTVRDVLNGPDGSGGDFEIVSHVPIEIPPTPFAGGGDTGITTVVRVAVPFTPVLVSPKVVGREVREIHFGVGVGFPLSIKMTGAVERAVIWGKSIIIFLISRNPDVFGGFLPTTTAGRAEGGKGKEEEEEDRGDCLKLHCFCTVLWDVRLGRITEEEFVKNEQDLC